MTLIIRKIDARLDQELANLSVKEQIVNILGFVVSVTAIQLCHFSLKAAREKYMKEMKCKKGIISLYSEQQ